MNKIIAGLSAGVIFTIFLSNATGVMLASGIVAIGAGIGLGYLISETLGAKKKR